MGDAFGVSAVWPRFVVEAKAWLRRPFLAEAVVDGQLARRLVEASEQDAVLQPFVAGDDEAAAIRRQRDPVWHILGA